MSSESVTTPYVLRYVYAILGIAAIAFTIVLVTLYVAQQDETQVHKRVESFHLQSISESDELRREVQILKDLVREKLDAAEAGRTGAVGVSAAQVSVGGILQSIGLRLERLAELEAQYGGVIFAATLDRFMDRFQRIDRELSSPGAPSLNTLLTIEVLGSTVEQYDRLHKIRADTALHALARRQNERPRFLAVLLACVAFSVLAGGYLVRSLSSSMKRQRATEIALAESQERLHHIQKLDALGRLVGGVAHDFNNWLTVILGHTDLLRDRAAGDERLENGLGEIKQAGLQAATLTQQLLAFSRRQTLLPRRLDLNTEIEHMEPMLRRIIGEDIKLTFRYADDPYAIEVDPDQLQQVIMNLISNARDAMPQGGDLVVRTDNILVGPAGIEADGVPDGQYSRLTVSDSGAGMTDATLERIFEPFFTTKEEGHGTGLGLSTVHGIVAGSNGHILVDTVEGSGTRFHIYFPRVEGHVAATDEGDDSADALRGDETVLVVEDDMHVRKFVETGLASLGYRVLTATGGAGGLDVCRNEPGGIDVILSDVIMPEISGPKFMAGALKLRPDAVAIYMSAYTKDEVLRFRRPDEVDIPLVSKPFTLEDLSRIIRKQLKARQ